MVLDIGCGLIPEAMFDRWGSGVVYNRALSRFRSENGISHKIGLTALRYVSPFIKIRDGTGRSRPPFRRAELSGFSRNKINCAADSRNTLRLLPLQFLNYELPIFHDICLYWLILCIWKITGWCFPPAELLSDRRMRIDTLFSLRGQRFKSPVNYSGRCCSRTIPNTSS